MHRMLFAMAGLLLAGGFTYTQAQPAKFDKTVSVEANAPNHKPNGKTWDLEIPVMIGILMPNLGDPAPDMMLCVVDGTSANYCIHDSTSNQLGVPFSICRNAYKCTFPNVKVPSSGYFGFLLVDLDETPTKQDYMLAAIMHYGQEDEKESWKVEKALRALIAQWHVVDAPDGFPDADVRDCTMAEPCFGSERGGIPSLGISTAKISVCGMPIEGELTFGPGEAPGTVGFRFQLRQNECPGTTEYYWQFGDGKTEITHQPTAVHRYDKANTYPVRVVVRCVRKTQTCETAPQSTKVTIQ